MQKGSLALTSVYQSNNFGYSRIRNGSFFGFGSRFYNYTENEVAEEVTKIWSNYPSNIANYIHSNRLNSRRETEIPNFIRDEEPPNRPDYIAFHNSIILPKHKSWSDYIWTNKTKSRLLKFKKTFGCGLNLEDSRRFRQHMMCTVECRHCWTLWDKDETFFRKRVDRFAQELNKLDYFDLVCWKNKARLKIWLERSRRSKQKGYVISQKMCPICNKTVSSRKNKYYDHIITHHSNRKVFNIDTLMKIL